MDLYQAIKELREDLNRLDQVIQFLEQLVHSDEAAGNTRSRKSINETRQRAVSQRMKKYFARRKGSGAKSKDKD
jgi:hypothetical protein